MHDALITVVVPVYNVAAYLHRCVNSILSQTYQNLEILLIDDGSPDDCPALCDAFAKQDDRVRVIHKANAGLGMARNTGLENATGRYICFFDSDDYVEPDTIAKCVQMIEQTQAQIVLYGYHKVDKSGTVIRSYIPNCTKSVYSGEEIRTVILPDLMYDDPGAAAPRNLCISMWGALFSMELIRKTGWRSVSEREIISEDIYSLMQLYSHVDKVAILQEAFYYYCENESSLTHTYRPDRFSKIKHFYRQSLKQIEELNYNGAVKQRLDMIFLSYTIAALKQEVAAPRSVKESLAGVKAIICDDVTQSVLRTGKNPHDSMARKLLLLAIGCRMHRLCYIFLKAKG